MIKQTENKRYKLLEYKNELYLLDMDSNKITWFFPFLVWFLPLKAYKVDHLNLSISKKEKENPKLGGAALSASILSSILIRRLDETFWKTVYIDNKPILFLLLLFTGIGTLFIRFYFRYKKNKYETNECPINIKIYFTFKKAEYFSKLVFSMLFAHFIIFLMCSIVMNYGNFLPLIIVVPLIYLLSIINTTILSPEKIKDIELKQSYS